MPRIIFTSRYIQRAGKGQIRNLVKYMATRPNAEKLKTSVKAEVTKNQKKWIEDQVRQQPELKELFEYGDYSCYSGYRDYKSWKL